VRYHALKWDTQQLTSEVSKIEVGLKIMISFKCERLAAFYPQIEGGLLEWESSGLTLEVTPMFS
jgi:hypothetical protein